jgi:hypothetical protein
MKRPAAALIALLTVTIIAVPTSAEHTPRVRAADAHAAPWRWKTVQATPPSVPGGAQADIVIDCPAGYRPVSLEWHLDSNYALVHLLVRQAEYLDYSGNWGRLLFYNPGTVTRTVYASLNCVDGDDVGPITVVGKDVPVSSGGGYAQCPVLTQTLIGGGADWSSTENSRSIDFEGPTSSGWYATGHGASGTLHIEAYCIAIGYQSGMHTVTNQAGASNTSVSCSAGERVVSGGGYAYAVGGSIDPSAYKGYLIAVGQQQVGAGALSVSAFITSGTGSTWLVAIALCAPVSMPSLTINLAPSGDQASSSIGYSFSASDQAGEDLRYQCYLNGSAGYPCVSGHSTNIVSRLADASYTMQVEARNDSNQTDSKSFSFRVDTKPPAVTVGGKPPNATRSRAASFTVTATDVGTGVAQVFCHIDAYPEAACPTTAHASGLADGSHAFAWRAVDGVGNATTGSFAWLVDNVAPTAALTAPSAHFTQGSSITVKWKGLDAGSGIASWQVQWQRAKYNGHFGAWSKPRTIPAGTSTKAFTKLPGGYDDCYRVRAIDAAGNTSAYSRSRCSAVVLDDRALTTSRGWTRGSGNAYYAGTVTSTTQRNATLTRSGAQLDRLALLATTCPTCGTVGVYVNGALVGAVNLQATTTRDRQLIELPSFGSRTGAVTIKVLTNGKLVRIDGLGISRT